MLRRAILVGMVLLALLAGPLAGPAQAAQKIPRIGYLTASSRSDLLVGAFKQGLRELGYVEGQDFSIEYRFAEGRLDRLPTLAAELVGLKVDVILAAGIYSAGTLAQATRAIPIVIAAGIDPVAAGLAASLARPGGNVTGLSFMSPDLGGKRLDLLKAAVPKVSRVAALFNPAAGTAALAELRDVEAAAKTLRVKLLPLEVRRSDDLDAAFRRATSERAHGLITFRDPLFQAHQRWILDLAAKARLATMFAQRDYVEAGGLMSYGPSVPDLYRRAATFVDKILKGAKPADLPVEQPTRFELVVNMKTAKALGLTVPPSILVRADQVIQ